GSILFPGGSWHKRQRADPQGIADFITRELPFGRFGRADEVANLVAFLASTRASWISGASIPIDGVQGRSNICIPPMIQTLLDLGLRLRRHGHQVRRSDARPQLSRGAWDVGALGSDVLPS